MVVMMKIIFHDVFVAKHSFYLLLFCMLPTFSFVFLSIPIQDCVLYAVGKPMFFKQAEQNYGAWLRDPMARNDVVAERIWMTKENDGFQLFEYANKAAYKNNLASKVYRMQFPFKVSFEL